VGSDSVLVPVYTYSRLTIDKVPIPLVNFGHPGRRNSSGIPPVNEAIKLDDYDILKWYSIWNIKQGNTVITFNISFNCPFTRNIVG